MAVNLTHRLGSKHERFANLQHTHANLQHPRTSLHMFSMMTLARRLTTVDRSRSARTMSGTMIASVPSSMACIGLGWVGLGWVVAARSLRGGQRHTQGVPSARQRQQGWGMGLPPRHV